MEYFLYRIFSHLFIIVLYSTLLLFLLNETKEWWDDGRLFIKFSIFKAVRSMPFVGFI